MDLKFTKETITVKETVLDNCFEQAVETDYILPDYYPDIFRVIKCRIMPRIVSHSIIGNDLSTGDKTDKKLCYDTETLIRVWYLSENSKVINCIDQKMSFSKNVELKLSCENPEIYICPKSDYVNCRVVNQRRLEIRGAISTKIKVIDAKEQNIISDAVGCNIQLKKNMLCFPAKRLVASKKITVIEELELGIAKPPIISVIKSDCKIISKEHKAISNKLVVKGEAEIDMLYTCSKEDEHGIEGMKFSIPFSQIIDLEGVDESFDIEVNITQSGCDIVPKGSGEATSFECELVLMVSCVATNSKSCEIIEDAYSTCYNCELVTGDVKIDEIVKSFSESINCKSTLNLNDTEISSVIDCGCEISNISSHLSQDTNCFIINGNVSFYSLIETKEGFPVMVEGDSIFEHSVEFNNSKANFVLEPKISVQSCNYTMTGNNSIEVISDILCEGEIKAKQSKTIITDIKINTDSKKLCNNSCALKLYYAEENEDIWDIAKKNSTSVQAILDENEMSAESFTEKGMLLIPIIN